jgi:hypothetical protein
MGKMEQHKPLYAVNNLMSLIKANCTDKCLLVSKLTNVQVDFNGDERIFLLESGRVTINRKSDGKVLINIEAPFIIGLTTLFTNLNYYYIRTETDCHISTFSKNEVIKFIESSSSWKYVSEVLSYAFFMYYQRDEMLTPNNTYGVVRKYIEYFWENEDTNTTSIFSFILNRTSISRSSLNKILRELEIGGYIKTKRGILIEMNKLPNAF